MPIYIPKLKAKMLINIMRPILTRHAGKNLFDDIHSKSIPELNLQNETHVSALKIASIVCAFLVAESSVKFRDFYNKGTLQDFVDILAVQNPKIEDKPLYEILFQAMFEAIYYENQPKYYTYIVLMRNILTYVHQHHANDAPLLNKKVEGIINSIQEQIRKIPQSFCPGLPSVSFVYPSSNSINMEYALQTFMLGIPYEELVVPMSYIDRNRDLVLEGNTNAIIAKSKNDVILYPTKGMPIQCDDTEDAVLKFQYALIRDMLYTDTYSRQISPIPRTQTSMFNDGRISPIIFQGPNNTYSNLTYALESEIRAMEDTPKSKSGRISPIAFLGANGTEYPSLTDALESENEAWDKKKRPLWE